MTNMLIFLAEKNVSSKTINVFENTLATTVNKLVIHKLANLVMLRKTWPRCIHAP